MAHPIPASRLRTVPLPLVQADPTLAIRTLVGALPCDDAARARQAAEEKAERMRKLYPSRICDEDDVDVGGRNGADATLPASVQRALPSISSPALPRHPAPPRQPASARSVTVDELYEAVDAAYPLHHLLQLSASRPATAVVPSAEGDAAAVFDDTTIEGRVRRTMTELSGGAHLRAFEFYQACSSDPLLFPSHALQATAAVENAAEAAASAADRGGSSRKFVNVRLESLLSPRREKPRRHIVPVVHAEKMRHREATLAWAGKTDHRAMSAQAKVDTNLAALLPPPDHNPVSTARATALHVTRECQQHNVGAGSTGASMLELERATAAHWPRPPPPKLNLTVVVEPRSESGEPEQPAAAAGKGPRSRDVMRIQSRIQSQVLDAAGRKAYELGDEWYKAQEKNREKMADRERKREAARRARAERLRAEVLQMLRKV